jgi:anti-sigma B factor antagonist
MSISYVDVNEQVRRIVISGRLDVEGTDSVATQLEQLSQAPKKAVVVDLTSLKFLASIGIRALIASAKAVKQRGGRMFLVVDEGSTVMMSIKATGIDKLVPIFDDTDDAEKAAGAA